MFKKKYWKNPSFSQQAYTEATYDIQGPGKFIVVAYRPHTHHIGVVLSAYIVRGAEWIFIANKDPREPQVYFPLLSGKEETLAENDKVVLRCTMVGIRSVYSEIILFWQQKKTEF